MPRPNEEAGTEEEAIEAVKLAIELGNDVNAVDDNGETAMQVRRTRTSPRSSSSSPRRGPRSRSGTERTSTAGRRSRSRKATGRATSSPRRKRSRHSLPSCDRPASPRLRPSRLLSCVRIMHQARPASRSRSTTASVRKSLSQVTGRENGTRFDYSQDWRGSFRRYS